MKAKVPEDDYTENVEENYPNLSMSPDQSQIISIPYRILVSIFDEANKIRQEENYIVSVPGADECSYFVRDKDSPNNPRKVMCNPNTGHTKCDVQCIRFKGYKLCAHAVAVADKEKCLYKYVQKYKKLGLEANLTVLANANQPKNRGKKPKTSTQIRKGRTNITPTVLTDYQEREEERSSEGQQPCHLTFMAGIIKKCYGCEQNFSDKHRVPPHDLLLKRYDHRIYISPKSKARKKSPKLQNTYFHLNADCVRKRNPMFEFNRDVLIHEEIKKQLLDQHKQLLQSLGMDVE